MMRPPRASWARPLVWLLAPLVACALLVAARPSPRAGTRGPGRGRAAADPDARGDQVLRRIRLKFAVVAGVVRGRWTLFEAAALFRALDLSLPGFDWALFRERFPGRTDDERHCREVLHWLVPPSFQRGTEDRAALIQRLRCELEAAVRQGEVSLPDVSEGELADLRPAG